MAKNADGPVSGRTGFGYEQARGLVPWEAIRPRSTKEMVQRLKEQREDRERWEQVRVLADKYPSIRDEARRKRLTGVQTLNWLLSHDREQQWRHRAALAHLRKH